MSINEQITNLPCDAQSKYGGSGAEELAYQFGHRDARHAAAELAGKADGVMADLLMTCKAAVAALHRASSIHEIITVENDLRAAIAKAEAL